MLRPICLSLAAIAVFMVWGCMRTAAPPDEQATAETSSTPAADAPVAEAPIPAPTSPTPAPSEPTPAVAANSPATEPRPQPTPAPSSDASAPQAAVAEPEAILRRVSDFFQQVQSVQVDDHQTVRVTMQGINQDQEMRYTFAAERPNRFALRPAEGFPSLEIVSDGEQLYLHFSVLNRYTAEDAPPDFSNMLGETLASSMPGGMSADAQLPIVMQLLADDPYAKMMNGVTKTEYIAIEELDGIKTHHLRLIRDDLDRDLWVPVEGDPIVLQVSTDLGKMMANLQKSLGEAVAGQFKDMQMTSTENLRNWRLNASIDSAAFTFTPPEGAEQVDSLFGGLAGSEPEPSPLLGQAAPPIQLALLDGGSLDLASHAGHSVVMLDFWATWCGPCVEELPILAKVAADYQDKGVVFYAINQEEAPDDIRTFLEDQALSFTVALDTESKAGNDYGVQGIPTLVLVDKQGIVQSVHIGLSPNLEDELRQELDDLLAGKSLAEETLAKVEETPNQPESEPAAPNAAETPPENSGLEEVWSVEGKYAGVAVDHTTGTIYAVTAVGRCTAFGPEGEELHNFNAPERINALRSAKLTSDSNRQLLGFSAWGDTVFAMDADGKQLWKELGGEGINDVRGADLDNDGLDEVIVGYNGRTGLHVSSADGTRRWQYTDIGNVWHVSAGNVTGDDGIEIVTTSAVGQVHLFDAAGARLRDVKAPVYANMVRVGKFTTDNAYDSIVVVGSGSSGEQIVALKGSGTVQWTCALPASADHCDSLDIAAGAPWTAAGLRGGLVIVVNNDSGQVIAQASGLGERPEVAWHTSPTGGDPVLLTASGQNLKAFRIVPQN